MTIAERVAQVLSRIEEAARAAGRDPGSVRLVAVSKRKPPADIRAAYAAGLRDFGENYVQELVTKAEALSDLKELRFHMIGHLQRNKVRQVVGHVSVLHTVDTARLAQELGKRAADRPLPPERRFSVDRLGEGRLGAKPTEQLPVLVEVNVGGEAQKSGCPPGELAAVLAATEAEASLRLVGLMTVPPHTEDPALSRAYFDQLVALRAEHGGAPRLPELSMGMTHDLEYAVLAGATMVRVGTAIFGERPPKLDAS